MCPLEPPPLSSDGNSNTRTVLSFSAATDAINRPSGLNAIAVTQSVLPREAAHFALGLDVPDSHRTIRTGRRDVAALRAERDRRQRQGTCGATAGRLAFKFHQLRERAASWSVKSNDALWPFRRAT